MICYGFSFRLRSQLRYSEIQRTARMAANQWSIYSFTWHILSYLSPVVDRIWFEVWTWPRMLMEYVKDRFLLTLKMRWQNRVKIPSNTKKELCLTSVCEIKWILLTITSQSLAYLFAFQIYSASSTQSVGQTRESICVFHCSGR